MTYLTTNHGTIERVPMIKINDTLSDPNSANHCGGRAAPTIHLKTMMEVHHHTDVKAQFFDTSTLVY